MKEKRVSSKTSKAPRDGGAKQEPNQKDPRRETRRRIREIVERHRETFDELAK